ncbi:MAG TPA: PEP-CTERM sorting domain-containing protein [Edaphobacter sp.]|nr:PEP-CTERM sorting domain-containing protein [Edaphobacter sp.]
MRLPSVVCSFVLGVLLSPLVCHADTIITGVSFAGGPADPTITVEGSGFGVEPTRLTLAYPGYTGYDYGNVFFFNDFAPTQAYDWGAGRGVILGMRDLIGIDVVSYSDTRIVFLLGSTYSSYYYPLGIYELNSGDGYRMVLRDGSYTGTVSFVPEPDTIIGILTGLLPFGAALMRRVRIAQAC